MHTTTTTPALPGRRKQLRARNAAIAAVGIVSAVMVAAGAAIGGGKPVPSHTPATPAERTPTVLAGTVLAGTVLAGTVARPDPALDYLYSKDAPGKAWRDLSAGHG